ncbi:class I SAM-dependent methyltransferase [Micromonospora sp. WMMD882]|uniref:class I SAM-dependent methyltransferase n=1 Tax=Micromonospora sp. WMMD882 TaxID=3015151 RepID=UPI00248AA692|nr:class I SAM-dependent methyltransferase [Micromonospora sp. WMMD882]WBB81408.1 class I SAM-dependent methyltransferase [Micromonospora sp. WMMD882]
MRPEQAARMATVYRDRGYDADPRYHPAEPSHLQRTHDVERLVIRSLVRAGLVARLDRLRVLDVGCGDARWFGRWLAWGALPDGLHGIDVRASAVESGRRSFPGVDLRVSDGDRLPWPDASFDVVYQFLAMSSMTDPGDRALAAAEMQRVLRPGGLLIWYDMAVDNPVNREVRGVPLREVRRLHPTLRPLLVRRTSLAPPLARPLAARSWAAARTVEFLAPFLRLHLFAAFTAPAPAGASGVVLPSARRPLASRPT